MKPSRADRAPRAARIADFTASNLALLVPAAAAAALFFPEPFVESVPVSCIPAWLGAVMFGMGLTLSGRDFALLLKRPFDVAAGVLLQFTVMPLAAWAVARALSLPPELALGVILVGACPGGTASNVISYLAKGDVALSVTLTSCSTVLAPVLTPAIVLLFAGRSVDVNAVAMFVSILQVVLLPIGLGVAVSEFLPRAAASVRRYMPAFSAVAVTVIASGVVAANARSILYNAGVIFLAVVLHNLLGLAAGYGAAAALRMCLAKRRTLAIEVGMQNSGLAVSLAAMHFPAFEAATVPGAIFSVWHNISGALLAAWWARRSRRETPFSARQGTWGEKLAVRYLEREKGMKTVAVNVRVGRFDEIDAVMRERRNGVESVVFVEVKTRGSDALGGGIAALDGRKRRALGRAARRYMRGHPDTPFRIDLVEVIGSVGSRTEPRIYHYENAVRSAGRFPPV